MTFIHNSLYLHFHGIMTDAPTHPPPSDTPNVEFSRLPWVLRKTFQLLSSFELESERAPAYVTNAFFAGDEPLALDREL